MALVYYLLHCAKNYHVRNSVTFNCFSFEGLAVERASLIHMHYLCSVHYYQSSKPFKLCCSQIMKLLSIFTELKKS